MSARSKRWWRYGLGLAVALFGLLCLNYTKAPNDRHVSFARRTGLPEPGAAIFYTGALATVTGSGFVGYSLGARRD